MWELTLFFLHAVNNLYNNYYVLSDSGGYKKVVKTSPTDATYKQLQLNFEVVIGQRP